MMTTINTNAAVIDNRDGRTAVLGEKNSKCKTVIVFYDDPKENEVKGRSISYSTIKKHFSEIEIAEEEIAEEVAEAVEEPAVVEIEDGIEVAEFEDEEEVTEVKEKKERKKRGTTKKTFEELIALLPASANVTFSRMKDNSVAVKCGKKRIFRFDFIGSEYLFRADRIENLKNILGVKIIEKKSGKKFAEVRSADVETVVAKIMANAKANGCYVA